MKVLGDFLGPPRSTDKTTLIIKVSNGAKIRNRYNQVPHLTQDTNGKVTNSQKTPQTRAKRSALSQQVKVNGANYVECGVSTSFTSSTKD